MTKRRSQSDQLKRARAEIRLLKQDISTLQRRLAEVDTDRKAYRRHSVQRIHWFADLLGKGSAPNVEWILKDEAKFLTSRQPFSWEAP